MRMGYAVVIGPLTPNFVISLHLYEEDAKEHVRLLSQYLRKEGINSIRVVPLQEEPSEDISI